MTILGPIVLLLVVVGVVVLIVVGVRRLTGHDEGGGIEAAGVRRFFQYLLLYGLLVVSAVGLSGLLARVLGTSELISSGTDLARGLTFTIIGVPLYLLVAASVRRNLVRDDKEARSLGWAFYVTVSALTALVVSMFALYQMLTWLMALEPYDGLALARLLVWGAVWVVHWLAEARFSPPGRRRLHHLAGSAIGLVAGAIGAAGLLAASLRTLIGTTGEGVVFGGQNPILEGAAVLVVGGIVWFLYWVRAASTEEHTPLWIGYGLLAGVAAGLIAAITAASTVLYDILVWLIGQPAADDPAVHFNGFPAALATAVVGMTVWWYHHAVLEEAAAGERTEARRIYEYLMAGVGLLTAAAGVATVLVAFVEAVAGGSAISVGQSAINTLLAAVTMLVVGAPVWWTYWRGIERHADVDPEAERGSLTRRIYLFILFGLGGITAVISLLVGVFMLFDDLFQGSFGSETVRSMRFPIGILATTGAIAGFHWVVYRADRAHEPATEGGPRFILLIGPPDEEIAGAVSRLTGGRARLWSRVEDDGAAWSAEQVASALEHQQGQEVVVISHPSGVEVIPVDRG